MLSKKLSALAPALLSTAMLAAACGDDEAQNPTTTGAAAVEAWLTKGLYQEWACEAAAHEARAPSPHGQNRICSNDLLSGHGAGEYPVGAASVKELYDDARATIIGYAVGVHLAAGGGRGGWYWYERVPLDHPAPHDAAGVVADGRGDSGPAGTICTGCHAGAGSDAMHSGHDMVYTQVK